MPDHPLAFPMGGSGRQAVAQGREEAFAVASTRWEDRVREPYRFGFGHSPEIAENAPARDGSISLLKIRTKVFAVEARYGGIRSFGLPWINFLVLYSPNPREMAPFRRLYFAFEESNHVPTRGRESPFFS